MQDPTYRCGLCSTRTTVVLHPVGEDCPNACPLDCDRHPACAAD